jgi:hypothetical protein
MCDFVLVENLTCGHSAVATCPDCLGEFCNNHLDSHDCVEIISTSRNAPMPVITGQNASSAVNPLVDLANPNPPSPDEISAKAYQLLDEIKSSGCAGIVIILGTQMPQVQLIGHGTNNSNAAETLREIARAVDAGGVVSELEFDLRPFAAN